MAKENPFVGGPDYVKALCAVLQGSNAFRVAPPSASGSQLSIRMLDDRLELLKVLGEKSGWNRNQLLIALLDKGLWFLFAELNDETAGKIIKERISKALRQPGVRRVTRD